MTSHTQIVISGVLAALAKNELKGSFWRVICKVISKHRHLN